MNKSCYPECRCGINGLIDFLVNQIPVCITSETMLVERNKLNKKNRQKNKNALWVSLYHRLFVYFILLY